MARVTISVDGDNVIRVRENDVGHRWAALILLTDALDLEPVEIQKAKERLK